MPEVPYPKGWSKKNEAVAVEAGYSTWQEFALEVEASSVHEVICGARNKKNLPCALKAGHGVEGKDTGRCKTHGGNSLVGTNSPSFKNGRHSRYMAHLRGRTREAFEAHMANPDILGLTEEIGIIRTQIEGLWAHWPESVASLEEIGKLIDVAVARIGAMEEDASGIDRDLMSDLKKLKRALEPLDFKSEISAELDRKLEVLRKLVDTNVKREKSEFEQVSAGHLGMWTVTIRDMILEFVPDPDDRQVIVHRIEGWIH
jgi:hypothetical protein